MPYELVDLTAYPIYQGASWLLPITFGAGDPLAADDTFELDFREAPGQKPVGSISTDVGKGVTVDMATRTARLELSTKLNKSWYKSQIKAGELTLTDATRIRTLYTTVVHQSVDGSVRPLSGLLGFKLSFVIGETRDD